MVTDTLLDNLPDDPHEAFVIYESACREIMTKGLDGSWRAERLYVSQILAFIDSYELEVDLGRATPFNEDFAEYFHNFTDRVAYYVAMFRLERSPVKKRRFDTTLYFNQDFRAQVYAHINEIAKIVASAGIPDALKESIVAKLSALWSEVGRSRTRLDAFLAATLDIANAAGKAGAKLEPAIEALDKLTKVFARVKAANESGELPPPESQPRLPPAGQSSTSSSEEEDIPF